MASTSKTDTRSTLAHVIRENASEDDSAVLALLAPGQQ